MDRCVYVPDRRFRGGDRGDAGGDEVKGGGAGGVRFGILGNVDVQMSVVGGHTTEDRGLSRLYMVPLYVLGCKGGRGWEEYRSPACGRGYIYRSTCFCVQCQRKGAKALPY